MYRGARTPAAAHLHGPGQVAVNGVGIGDGEGGWVGGLGAGANGPRAAWLGPMGRQHHCHAPEEGPPVGGAVQHGGGTLQHPLHEGRTTVKTLYKTT